MHIPSSSSLEVELLTLEEALTHRDGSASYDRDRWLYVPDFYSEYRYLLGTVGKRPLITIGINPSTAEPDNLDNTLKSVSRIAAGNGFDSFLMFKVYAQRATNPDHMDRVMNEALHRENMKAFRWVLERAGEEPVIWAAWGAVVEKRDYLVRCLSDMVAVGEEFGARWVQAGTPSVKGHPHHPLYLKKDSAVEPFEMKAYLQLLSGREAKKEQKKRK